MYFVACVIKQKMKCILIFIKFDQNEFIAFLVTFRVLKRKENYLSDED